MNTHKLSLKEELSMLGNAIEKLLGYIIFLILVCGGIYALGSAYEYVFGFEETFNALVNMVREFIFLLDKNNR